MDFAKRIDELRNERKWTIYRLYVESGISQQTIKSIPENKDIQLSTIEKLCEAFDISVSDFFKDENRDTMDVTVEQKQLLTDWSAMTTDTQESFRNLMKTIIETQN